MEKSDIIFLWNHLPYNSEVSDYRIKDSDRIFVSRPYIFIVEEKGNVLLRKFTDGGNSIKRAFQKFEKFLREEKIQYIRVEGRKNRYRLLFRLFPGTSILQDSDEKERDIFYIKVY